MWADFNKWKPMLEQLYQKWLAKPKPEPQEVVPTPEDAAWFVPKFDRKR
jgi:hypothetical protein